MMRRPPGATPFSSFGAYVVYKGQAGGWGRVCGEGAGCVCGGGGGACVCVVMARCVCGDMAKRWGWDAIKSDTIR